MAEPLILKGNLKLGTTAETAVDVSEEVTTFKVMGEVSVVEIPPTLARERRNRGGSATYSLEIGYLSSDEADGVFRLLWAAIGSQSKELYFEGSMRDDVVSADNPLYTGRIIVVGAAVGGEAEALSTDSNTYPMVEAPELVLTPEAES